MMKIKDIVIEIYAAPPFGVECDRKMSNNRAIEIILLILFTGPAGVVSPHSGEVYFLG